MQNNSFIEININERIEIPKVLENKTQENTAYHPISKLSDILSTVAL